MRRGQTLLELVVSLAILAIVVAVSLRLVFISDRALGQESDRVASVGGQAQLLEDLGRDLRTARSAVSAGGRLHIISSHSVIYQWSGEKRATVRRVIGQPNTVRHYPGVQTDFAVRGKFVEASIRSDAGTLRTGFCMRN